MNLSITIRTRPVMGLLLTALLAASYSASGDSLIRSADSLVWPYLSSDLFDSTVLTTHEGDVTNFNGDYGSPDWMAGGFYRNWQSVSMVAAGPTQVSATFKGTQEYDFISPKSQTATIRDFSLTNVSLNPDNVQLMFHAPSGETSFSLDNSTVDLGNTPSFYVPVRFNLNANGGSSQINAWQGHVGSSSTITVAAGSTLEFFRSGQTGNNVPLNSRLDFNQTGNLANVNGGTLIINESNVRFSADTATDGLAIRSGGTLQLQGFDSRLETDKMTVVGGTANLNDNTYVVAKEASLQNAAVTVGDGSNFSIYALYVAGATTVKTTFSLAQPTNPSMTSGAMRLADDTTTLNVTGDGFVDLDTVFFYHGTINVKDTAGVMFRAFGQTDLVQGTLNVDQGADVTIAGGHIVTQTASMALTNNGSVYVNDGSYTARGHSTIGGAGLLEVGSDGILAVAGDVLGQGHGLLTTTNTLSLDSLSTTRLTINPLALMSDHIEVQNDLFIDSLALANLDLLLVDDTVLNYGTKFLLFEYANTQGSHHFAGLANGAMFGLGLNHYQILYDDPAYNGHAITLTAAAPEPSTFLLFGAAIGSLPLLRRRSKISHEKKR